MNDMGDIQLVYFAVHGAKATLGGFTRLCNGSDEVEGGVGRGRGSCFAVNGGVENEDFVADFGAADGVANAFED